jgi:Ni/Co efflux regulator RcnB
MKKMIFSLVAAASIALPAAGAFAQPYPDRPAVDQQRQMGGQRQMDQQHQMDQQGRNNRSMDNRGMDIRPLSSGYGRHHRRQVCYVRHHHRVCHWR